MDKCVVITTADGGLTALQYLGEDGDWSSNPAHVKVLDQDKAMAQCRGANRHFVRIAHIQLDEGALADMIPPPMMFRGIDAQIARERVARTIAEFLRDSH